jgi:hypothetical protein
MTVSENFKTYSKRMQSFVSDPELLDLDTKYDPYLELHQIDDVLDTFEIIQNTATETLTGKLIWNTELELPTELKKDLMRLFDRHFVD